MANNDSKYHGEVKVQVAGRECRINVFGDYLAEIFQDIGTIVAQFPTAWVPPTDAGRELAAADLRKAQGSQPLGLNGKPLPPPGQPQPQGQAPTCVHCGSWEDMELIEFPSKKTGELKKAWKCQACEQWHWPNSKKQ